LQAILCLFGNACAQLLLSLMLLKQNHLCVQLCVTAMNVNITKNYIAELIAVANSSIVLRKVTYHLGRTGVANTSFLALAHAQHAISVLPAALQSLNQYRASTPTPSRQAATSCNICLQRNCLPQSKRSCQNVSNQPAAISNHVVQQHALQHTINSTRSHPAAQHRTAYSS
jgi:hypothetical protein